MIDGDRVSVDADVPGVAHKQGGNHKQRSHDAHDEQGDEGEALGVVPAVQLHDAVVGDIDHHHRHVVMTAFLQCRRHKVIDGCLGCRAGYRDGLYLRVFHHRREAVGAQQHAVAHAHVNGEVICIHVGIGA